MDSLSVNGGEQDDFILVGGVQDIVSTTSCLVYTPLEPDNIHRIFLISKGTICFFVFILNGNLVTVLLKGCTYEIIGNIIII